MAFDLLRFQKRFPDVPVVAQLGVALAAKKVGVRITKTIGPTKEGTALDRSTMSYKSLTVVEEQAAWLKENGQWPAHAVVLTSPDHIGRVLKVMKKQGFKDMLPLPLSSLNQKDYLDGTSLYLSFRVGAKIPFGGYLYRLRELASRFLFLVRGWI